jgi:sulfide:quinone oxidoreductase
MPLSQEEIMSPFRTITPNFSASPQISVADVAQAARDGFTAVICNRPDHEDMGQVSAQEIAKACTEHGLSFTHIPVSGGIPEEAVPLMREALAASTGPVLAYCRSGTRSTNLWALAEASAGGSPEELVEAGGRGGYDLRGLMPLLRSLSQAR